MRHKSSFLTETAKRGDKRLGGGKAGMRGGGKAGEIAI